MSVLIMECPCCGAKFEIGKNLSAIPNAAEWIPVTERLPEASFPCLIFDDPYIEYGYRNRIGEWMDFEGNTLKSVTHWMLLPKPPKGE